VFVFQDLLQFNWLRWAEVEQQLEVCLCCRASAELERSHLRRRHSSSHERGYNHQSMAEVASARVEEIGI